MILGRLLAPKLTLIAECCFLSVSPPKARDGSGNRGLVDSLAPKCGLGAVESSLVRVGPTTPTRAGTLADASVDPTEARKAEAASSLLTRMGPREFPHVYLRGQRPVGRRFVEA